MIRPIAPNDEQVVMAIAKAIDLFSSQELEEFGCMLTEYFNRNMDSDRFWITYDNGNSPVGVAYYAPEPYTQGTWNLYFIAVHPDSQGQGYGARLLHYIEQMLAERGERVLLVETSGLSNFERTRAFYRKQGYEEEARIREFYKAGDDKIIFGKALNTWK